MTDATRTGSMGSPDATTAAGDAVVLVAPAAGYDLGEEIGRGGMGVVYRARDRGLDREVAVKLLQDRYAPTSGTAARFVEEARITGQLQHPGIPPVYHVGTWTDGRPFLAMKLINGRTLDELLKAEGPDATRWLGVFEGICHAVGYAHAGGVIHRDLKPANVMVGAFGEVQVMDWGLAKVLSPLGAVEVPPDTFVGAVRSQQDSDGSFTQVGAVLGTPAFMPPEQAAGAGSKIDRRADVFGLGAILCVLLTGAPPFDGTDAQSVWQNAARGATGEAFARLDALAADPGVIALCKRCLAFAPDDRPATATVVASAVADLRRAADDRAKQAEFERARAVVRAAEKRSRRQTVAAGVGALAVVFALGTVGTGLGLVRADRERAEARAAEAEARRLGAEADRERERAAVRLDKAVEAVERMVTRASTARWARDPSLMAERRQVLEDAVTFYQGLGETDAPVVRRETARAYRRIGAAYLLLAEYPKAADYLARALVLCDGLAAEFPDDPGYAADLAETRLFVAHEAASSGRDADAQAGYRDAVTVARRAADARPADDETRRTFVLCLLGYGFFTMQGDLSAARTVFQEAVGAVDGLLARPDAPFPTRALAAYTHASAAMFHFAELNRTDGMGKIQRASAILAGTVPDPIAPAFYRDLFDTTSGLLKTADAEQLSATRPDRAALLFREAAETFDRLLVVYPDAFQYRLYQVMILNQEVQVLTRLGRTADAERRRAELLTAEAAVRKSSPNVRVVKRLAAAQRSVALVNRVATGDTADLDQQVEDLLATAGDAPNMAVIRYNVACALSVGSLHGPAADREVRCARAVRLLTELLDGPFYRGPTNVAHVDADTDLNPIRDRSDFRAFRAKLGPPPVAPPPHTRLEK